MKKYYVPTDDSNRVAVLDALERVGFKGDLALRSFCDNLCVTIREGCWLSNATDVQRLGEIGYHLLEASYVIAHADELDGARKDDLNGQPMSEWLLNEDKVAFWELPELVKDEICKLADGKAGGNLQFYFNFKKDWLPTNVNPRLSHGSTFRIKEKKPWEIAPEGYRLATDDERRDNEYPKCGIGMDSTVRWFIRGSWFKSIDSACWNSRDCFEGGLDHTPFAVPLDFTFENPRIKELQERIKADADELAELKRELGE